MEVAGSDRHGDRMVQRTSCCLCCSWHGYVFHLCTVPTIANMNGFSLLSPPPVTMESPAFRDGRRSLLFRLRALTFRPDPAHRSSLLHSTPHYPCPDSSPTGSLQQGPRLAGVPPHSRRQTPGPVPAMRRTPSFGIPMMFERLRRTTSPLTFARFCYIPFTYRRFVCCGAFGNVAVIGMIYAL